MSEQNLYETIISGDKLTLIAGPCVLESEEIALRVAEFVQRLVKDFPINYIFKSSFEKANRTSVHSYRGPGLEAGLKMLEKIKKELGVPVLTDVHNEMQAPLVGEVADVLQIPAFLSRQTELLEAVGRTDKIVNIKKAQFMAPEDLQSAAEKVSSTGNNKILLTERGTFFGYHNLVVDMRSLVIMNKLNYPVIFDATHSVQLPSAGDGTTGGQPQFIAPLARAAMATGQLKGIFFEVHPNPPEALSDASSMLNLSEFSQLLKEILDLFDLQKKWAGEVISE